MTDSLATDLGAIAAIKAVPVLLGIVCRTTGAGLAAVARVTETRWVAAAAHDGLGLRLQPGAELPIETTLCAMVRERRQTLAIEDVSADSRFRQHPGPPLLGFQSYISAPILRADGSFFGTIAAFHNTPLPLARPETRAMMETFAELIGFHLSASDHAAVTEASLLLERRTSALREQFIAVLGHDLRNPLTGILGGMEMLRKNPLNDRAAQWADMVVASASRMAELIDVVVDFSRIRLGGGLDVERAACASLEPALRQLLDAMRAAKPGRLIEARLSVDAPVHCDQRRIIQLAANLLNNALTYGQPDRPVRLTALVRDGGFELSVANAGTPIPPELLERIFEPFSRGAVQPSRQGLGLGLYISYQIARAHGGALEAVSTPAETRFTFRMPLSGPASVPVSGPT